MNQECEYRAHGFYKKHQGEATQVVLLKIYRRAYKCGFNLTAIENLAENMLWAYKLEK